MFPIELLTAANAIALIVLAILFRRERRMRSEQRLNTATIVVALGERVVTLEQEHHSLQGKADPLVQPSVATAYWESLKRDLKSNPP